MTPAEARAYLRIPERTWYRLRKQGKGPKGIRYTGGCVRFPRAELDRYKSAHQE